MNTSLQNPAIYFLLSFVLLLPACSSHIPVEISEPLPTELQISQVRENIDQYIGQKVRWGGSILSTDNKENTSLISIVSFPLNGNGRPTDSGESSGRFIAVLNDFLEPLVYSEDRQITINGTITGTENRKVGEFLYNYPVVKVEHYHLWAPLLEYDNDYPPHWWYEPWYYPHYPYYHHPLRKPAVDK